MKLVSDISVTSALGNTSSVPWQTPWASPISQTFPKLVLDFAASVFGKDDSQGSLQSVMSFSRASEGTYINASGALAIAGQDVARIDHDPNSMAPIGLLSERAATNLFLNSSTPADQTISVGNVVHVFSFFGNGTVTFSGAHVGNITGTGAFPARTEYAFTPSAGDVTITISGDVQNAQLEEGQSASSYVSTTNAAVTRADDLASVGLGTWFNATQGTLVFGGQLVDGIANDRVLEIDAGDTSTRLSILWNTTLGKPQFQVWNSGALQAAIAPSGNSVAFGSNFRIAVSFSENDFVVSLNGSVVVQDTLGTLPGGLTDLRIGRSIWGAQGLLVAESLVYYPTRLSDAEVQALST